VLYKPKRLGYNGLVSSLRVGEVRFRVYPQDHEPRHVHGFIGSGTAIVDLRADGTVSLANRSDNTCGLTRSEVRKVLDAAADAFNDLAKLWEEMHDA
jgi:hypothetical protein